MVNRMHAIRSVMDGRVMCGGTHYTDSAIECRKVISRLARLGFGAYVEKWGKAVMFSSDPPHD